MKRRADPRSFYDHFDELRGRLIKIVVSVLLCSCFAYQFKENILSFIIDPVDYLIFTAPSDAFVVQVGLSLFIGFLAASPFVLYQIWQFVAGALKEEEKKFVRSFGPFSLVLFIAGALFAYFLVVPLSLRFLLSFSSNLLVPMISVRNYISFITTMILAFGVIFEFPLVILFLTKIGIATPAFLIQQRKYAVVLIFIVSALITPPDLITQWMMAVPLIFLYELSIFMAKHVAGRDFVYEA